jgi:hypothetical protein
MTTTVITTTIKTQEEIQVNYFNSSALEHGTYNPENRLMTIVFRGNPKEYGYSNIHPTVWQDLIQAVSAGAYFNQYIRPYYGHIPQK